MQLGLILPYYISWHYTRALRDITEHVKNMYWFTWNLFSFRELLRTFFAPFQRLGVTSTKRFDPQQMLEAFVTTLLMRIIGMLVRGFFIVLGVAVLCCLTIVATLFFVVWLVLPIILAGLVVRGGIQLFS